MLTSIKTQELIKLINPIEDGVLYKNEIIKIDLKELKKYVDKPKTYQVFSPATTISEALHKNISIYIINSDNKNKFISIDLNKEPVVEQGLFEYIKNIYNNQEITHIDIAENDKNNILIKSKKLEPITDDLFKQSPMEKAVDTEIVGGEFVFVKTQKAEENLFFKGDDVSADSNAEFILHKLLEASKLPISQIEPEFYRLLGNANKKLIETDEFKSEFLAKMPNNLICLLAKKPNDNIFSIDFDSPLMKEHLLSKVRVKDFSLLVAIFDRNQEIFKHNTKLYWDNLRKQTNEEEGFIEFVKLDYSTIVQQPEVIDYIIERKVNNTDGESKSLSVVSCYQYLTPEQQMDYRILTSYIDNIHRKDYQNKCSYNKKLLYKLPAKLFNDSNFLHLIRNFSLDYSEIKTLMRNEKVRPTLFADPNYILGKVQEIDFYSTRNFIEAFVRKDDITKDFAKSLIAKKSEYYTLVQDHKKFNHFKKDFDLFVAAVNNGFPLDRVYESALRLVLLKESDNNVHEDIKIKCVIAKDLFDAGKKYYKTPEEVAQFNEKYLRPEYMYFTNPNKIVYENKTRAAILGKITEANEILDILDKAEIFKSKCDFEMDTSRFYAELSPHLKKNKKIVEKLISIHEFSYNELDEHLQVNKDLLLKFLKTNELNAKYVPVEYFKDKEFTLEFAKLIDEGMSAGNIAPVVLKFFESQKVYENYHSFLTTYLTFHDLHENMEVTAPTRKKMKL